MQINKTYIIIGASFLALLSLFAFQTKWMTDSRKLIEEQFNQKVNMAMSYSVSILGEEEVIAPACLPGPNTAVCAPSSPNTSGCGPVTELEDGFQLETKNMVAVETVKNALGIAMDFYNIKMDYEVDVIPNKKFMLSQFEPPKYSCTLNPLQKSDSNLMIVSFPGKEEYIFGKMRFMFFSSIIILAFLTLVFLLSSYTMLKQRRMHQINKEFFNNMAHEFRTPLANISLAGSLLSKKMNDPKEIKYLSILKEESSKLANQVDHILQLSKIENGEYQLEKEKLCLENLIQTVINGMELQIKEKNAQINFTIKDSPMALEGDKFHLGNAFRNLLENALKYSKTDPIINITLEKEKEGVLIHFEDNGIGIDKKDQKEIFEKYYRVNQGNVHDQKGFGLGLTYVKLIIERHKGIINIFSDLNKGTRFDLFLPAN